MRYAGANTSYK